MSEKAGELAGKTAVVTGSSSGIGRAIALELAAGGASVLVHAHRSREKAEEVRARIEERGGGERSPCAGVLLADLREEDGRDRLLESAWKELGSVDIWVNNAGADILTGGRQSLSYEEKLDELLRLDVRATIALSREVGRRMEKRAKGTIVNIGWDQAWCGMEGESGELFAAAKGAVMCFTKSLALTLAPGVRVNCIAPGWIRTTWGESASESWQRRVLREIPLERWGTPEDVASVARFLASPAAAFITGQVINVNGGAVR